MNLKEFISFLRKEQEEKKGSVMNETQIETEVLDLETGLPVVQETTEEKPPFELDPTLDGLESKEILVQTPGDKGQE